MRSALKTAAFLLAALAMLSSLGIGASIKKKEEAVASVEKHKAEIIELSDQVWCFAEIGRAHV